MNFFGFTYIVLVSDTNPFEGPSHPIPYRFPNQRRAYKFAEDSMGAGHFVTMHREACPKITDPLEP